MCASGGCMKAGRKQILISLNDQDQRQMRALAYWEKQKEDTMLKNPGLFVKWTEKMMEIERKERGLL